MNELDALFHQAKCHQARCHRRKDLSLHSDQKSNQIGYSLMNSSYRHIYSARLWPQFRIHIRQLAN